MTLYQRTLIQESPWKNLSSTFKNNFFMFFYVVTWGALLLGYGDIFYWKLVIAITALQVFIMLPLVNFQIMVFPVQLRIVYTVWVALGTYVPELVFMIHVTTVGLVARIAFGYCPLARMLSLLPWNRDQSFSVNLLLRTIFQAPKPGRFEVVTK